MCFDQPFFVAFLLCASLVLQFVRQASEADLRWALKNAADVPASSEVQPLQQGRGGRDR
jgi:hypothetical protein